MNESSLILFDAEPELHELFDAWQSASTPEEAAKAEQAIDLYHQKELALKRVDSLRRYYRVCESQEQAAKAEAKAQSERAGMWRARADRMKLALAYFMDALGMKKIEGSTGKVLLAGNGGKQPLAITDESLVPDELCVWQGEIDGETWKELIKLANGADINFGAGVRMVRVANKEAVRKVLEGVCDACRGSGEEAIVTNAVMTGDTKTCSSCGGNGKPSVAGARLEPRGQHIEIK